jgi:hypothetical protein
MERTGWIGNPLKNIVFLHDFNIFKTGSAHGADKICFQQTPGNSPGP